ncbi:MAG: hypothetical protein PHV61_08600 [Limnochordia bacterium]|nr:hypothetical protein [Limnochordia bacterium]MDD4518184.1 hypothetical protein [Limnochordia bacterium]
MRRNRCLFLVLVVGLLLSGCLGGASINLKIKPNPVIFEYQQYERDITVEVSTSGIGKLGLDTATLILYNDAEKEIWREVSDISTTIPFVVPGISKSFTETISLPEEYQLIGLVSYQENLLGKKFLLEIILEGSKTTQASVDISFQ